MKKINVKKLRYYCTDFYSIDTDLRILHQFREKLHTIGCKALIANDVLYIDEDALPTLELYFGDDYSFIEC